MVNSVSDSPGDEEMRSCDAESGVIDVNCGISLNIFIFWKWEDIPAEGRHDIIREPGSTAPYRITIGSINHLSSSMKGLPCVKNDVDIADPLWDANDASLSQSFCPRFSSKEFHGDEAEVP